MDNNAIYCFINSDSNPIIAILFFMHRGSLDLKAQPVTQSNLYELLKYQTLPKSHECATVKAPWETQEQSQHLKLSSSKQVKDECIPLLSKTAVSTTYKEPRLY